MHGCRARAWRLAGNASTDGGIRAGAYFGLWVKVEPGTPVETGRRGAIAAPMRTCGGDVRKNGGVPDGAVMSINEVRNYARHGRRSAHNRLLAEPGVWGGGGAGFVSFGNRWTNKARWVIMCIPAAGRLPAAKVNA
jgi:hypothetical protein